ncbi:serine/threonine protein kinase [Brevibacillus nitrificans]|uniref:serine/threonine protein kinase n=1 Tax=Brevibacillus nitrificans TaxID=651560 RepID=UPI00260785FE|nr:serine/threonine-protein kinase [Brevibacillus nitrificans]
MSAPRISEQDVINNVHGITDVEYLDKGGQKIVFSCKIGASPYVIKFLKIAEDADDEDAIQEDIVARAKREIEIMDRCDCSNLVKLGPIRMTEAKINGERVLFFTEEFIEGVPLHSVIKGQALSFRNTVQLGLDIAAAIQSLWNIRMVHRDIKPKNIVQRGSGSYVLLDAGIAFDLNAESLTSFGPVGTRLYMSPEQIINPSRSLDFRSDLFLLGLTMYESISQQHPFYQGGMDATAVMGSIVHSVPKQVMQLVPDIPPALNRVIMRLLAKQPHLRYKSIDSLRDDLTRILEGLE